MNEITFAPMLFIKNGVTNVEFYEKAFGATELRRWKNDNGAIHVAELSINGAIFHLHEANERSGFFYPGKYNGTTTTIGIFVPDVDTVMEAAIAAGAREISAATDFEYGYRQGQVKDPFGHHWLIQSKL
jgi:PhnB protein